LFNLRLTRTVADAFATKTNNFNILRLLAAIAVLYYHSFPLASGRGTHDPITSFLQKNVRIGLGGLAVGGFFVISGFLVAASYKNRNSLFKFAEARILRIYPGLIAAVLFCAFIVGPLCTNLSLLEYFSSDRTWSFVTTNSKLIWNVQYRLPGVFEGNHLPGVNGSLWTLPVELWLYMWIAIIGILGILKSKTVFNSFVCLTAIVYIISPEYVIILNTTGSIRNPLFFAIGSFIYINKEFIPLNWICFLCFSTVMLIWPEGFKNTLLSTVYMSYAIFFISFIPQLNAINTNRFGDLSYGIYIYAFPIQQISVHFFKSISPLEMFAYSFPVVVLLAMFSWNVVEKPSLRLKGRLMFWKQVRQTS
jgi:peptidoglycan/LPS O-acetylase OafA/YrhL